MYPGVPSQPPARVITVSPLISAPMALASEIDDPWHGLAVDLGYQDVRRLEIAVDHSFLMRVLHAFTNLDEQFQALLDREMVLIAVACDGSTRDVLHNEVGLTIRSGARVEDLGDGWMVHHRQGLTFCAEALQEFGVIHADLDQLERDLALHRCSLLREPDLSHAALAEPTEKLIRADGFGFSSVLRRSDAGREWVSYRCG